ncbi:MAG: helix-turn-helix domain-containing protein, partial [Chthoniobacterales bacterium]
MNEKDFELLCESIRQAGEIRRGKRKPARTTVVTDPDPKAIRERLGLSQSRFAAIIGVSIRTLQNWEQGRREPE